jgi:poly-beta-1,6-N-acetyl-D-glucosamine synthase
MPLQLAIVVPFLNEADLLPEFLASLAEQERAPDELILVDDGSSDASPELAGAFARDRPWARVLQRPARPAAADRMVQAHELRAFQWGVEQLESDWDVVAKLDADLRLPRTFFGELMERFADDRRLGMAGAYVSELDDAGKLVRHRGAPEHVAGATSFYRRECWEAIAPLPAILGWDTIDELRARIDGWRTESFALAGGDPLHLRRMGSYDGVLRGFRRAGAAAYAYGAHPAWVAASAISRTRERPLALCGFNYLAGWVGAAARRAPRAPAHERRHMRQENLTRMRAVMNSRGILVR